MNFICINFRRSGAISLWRRRRSSDHSDAWSSVLSAVHESDAARFEGGTHLVYRLHEDVGLALLNPDHDLPADPGSVGEFFLAEAEQCSPRSHRSHYFRCRIHGFIKNGTALALSTIVPKDSIGLLIRDITAQEADDLRRDHLIREGVHCAENLITVMSMVIDRTFAGNFDAQRHLKTRARVQAIAAAQAILGTSSVADIANAVRRTLQGFEEIGDRIRISSPPAILSETHTQGLSSALYELATNALEYVALSLDEDNSR